MKVQRLAEKTSSVSSEMHLNVPKPGIQTEKVLKDYPQDIKILPETIQLPHQIGFL